MEKQLRLRGESELETYVLPQKLSGFFELVVATSTRASSPLRFESNPREEVLRARGKFYKDVGAWIEGAVCMSQVHGDHIERVGARDAGRVIADTDGLVTDEPHVFLTIASADCVPVVVYDPRRRAVGAAHAGWRGVLARLPEKVVARMGAEFGSRPEDLVAWTGPSITASCYDVLPERAAAFEQEFGSRAGVVERRGEKLYLSLQTAVQVQLMEAGVPAGQIEISDACTACEPQLFFSHRVEGERRRDTLLTTIGLRK